MSHRMTTELVVCTTCRPAGVSRDEPAPGEELLQQIAALAAADGGAAVVVRGTTCLGSCSRACTLALQARGKHSYLFGDFEPDADSAAQALAGARQHAESPDGLLAWKTRPERLRRGIVARLPPLLPVSTALPGEPSQSTEANDSWLPR